MNITTNRITAAAGLCAAAAGAIFIGVQIGHPHLDSKQYVTEVRALEEQYHVLLLCGSKLADL